MRIALVHLRHAHTGGTERYLNQISAYLAERGHDVTIVCRRHTDAPHPNVSFVVLRNTVIGAAWRQWAFATAVECHLSKGGYDLVFALGRTWTHDVIRLGGGLTPTYLESAHWATLTPLERMAAKGFLKHRLAASAEARALTPGAYRRVITNSNMVRRDAINRHRLPEESISVIHNGVDLERFHPRHHEGAGAELRRTCGFTDEHCVVLFLGTGYGRKGLDLVLDALGPLGRQRPEVRLLTVGHDSARQYWEHRAARLKLADRVVFLGGRIDAEACYGAADVYVLPTRFDPFANSTLEALASGLPVVTSDANGGAELIEPGVQGDIVSVDDGPEAVLAALVRWCEPERRRQGARAARLLAERHGIASKLELTERVLLEVHDQAAHG